MRDVAAFVVVVDGGVAQPVFDALAPLAVLVADADALAQGVGLFDDAPLAVVFGFELQAARRVAVAGQRVRLACVFVAVGRLRAVWLDGSGKVARRVVAVAPLHAARACDAGDAPLRVAFKAQAPAARVADAVSGKLHGVALPVFDLLDAACQPTAAVQNEFQAFAGHHPPALRLHCDAREQTCGEKE